MAPGANRRGFATADIKNWTEVYDNCDAEKNEGIAAVQRTLF
jgi:hypothetical protein